MLVNSRFWRLLIVSYLWLTNLTYNTRSIPIVFKNFFSNLAESLLTKFPNTPDKYNLLYYCSSFTITDNFCLNKTSDDEVLKVFPKSIRLLTYYRLSGFFYEVKLVLSKPISELSVTHQYSVQFSLMLAKSQN